MDSWLSREHNIPQFLYLATCHLVIAFSDDTFYIQYVSILFNVILFDKSGGLCVKKKLASAPEPHLPRRPRRMLLNGGSLGTKLGRLLLNALCVCVCVCVCSIQSGNETKLVSKILLVKDYTQLYVHICQINPNYPTLINPT